MPDDETSQTPQSDGTGDQTPAGGTEGQTAAAAAPVTPPVTDYESKFKSSQAEAIRLYQENQRLNQILANTVQQQQAAPAPKGNGQDYSSLTDALLDRDYNKIADWENRIVENATKKTLTMQQQQAERGGRINASMQVVGEAFKEPNSALGFAAMERYKQLMYDPAYSFVQHDEIDIPTPQGNVKVNPHLMRIAVLESKASLSGKLTAAKDKARMEGESFIEPVGGSGKKPESGGKFDPAKHLTETERNYCDKTRKSYDEYWKFVDPKLQSARLKAGRAVSRQEAKV